MKRKIPLLSIFCLLCSVSEFIMFFQYINRIGIDFYSLKYLIGGILILLTALYWIFYKLYLLILYNLFLLIIIIFAFLFYNIGGNRLFVNMLYFLVIDAVLIFNEVKKK